MEPEERIRLWEMLVVKGILLARNPVNKIPTQNLQLGIDQLSRAYLVWMDLYLPSIYGHYPQLGKTFGQKDVTSNGNMPWISSEKTILKFVEKA